MYSGFVVTSLSDDVTEGSPEATQSPTVLYMFTSHVRPKQH
jgi:hypothetical protein